jgi:hypothetical protein
VAQVIGVVVREEAMQPRQSLAGADGGRPTAVELNRLPDDYVVFHDFHEHRPHGNRAASNIDHIVVGPTGVFVIDSTSPAPAAKSSERSRATRDRVKQAVRQALQVREWLQTEAPMPALWVHAVVVFADKNVIVDKADQDSAWVMPLRMLLGRIREQNRLLTHNDVVRFQKTLEQKRALGSTQR